VEGRPILPFRLKYTHSWHSGLESRFHTTFEIQDKSRELPDGHYRTGEFRAEFLQSGCGNVRRTQATLTHQPRHQPQLRIAFGRASNSVVIGKPHNECSFWGGWTDGAGSSRRIQGCLFSITPAQNNTGGCRFQTSVPSRPGSGPCRKPNPIND